MFLFKPSTWTSSSPFAMTCCAVLCYAVRCCAAGAVADEAVDAPHHSLRRQVCARVVDIVFKIGADIGLVFCVSIGLRSVCSGLGAGLLLRPAPASSADEGRSNMSARPIQNTTLLAMNPGNPDHMLWAQTTRLPSDKPPSADTLFTTSGPCSQNPKTP